MAPPNKYAYFIIAKEENRQLKGSLRIGTKLSYVYACTILISNKNLICNLMIDPEINSILPIFSWDDEINPYDIPYHIYICHQSNPMQLREIPAHQYCTSVCTNE